MRPTTLVYLLLILAAAGGAAFFVLLRPGADERASSDPLATVDVREPREPERAELPGPGVGDRPPEPRQAPPEEGEAYADVASLPRVGVLDREGPPPRLPPDVVESTERALEELRVSTRGRLTLGHLVDALADVAYVRFRSPEARRALSRLRIPDVELEGPGELDVGAIRHFLEAAGFRMERHPGVVTIEDLRAEERERERRAAEEGVPPPR